MYDVWYSSRILGNGQEVRDVFIVGPDDNFDPSRHHSYGYMAGPFETKEDAMVWLKERDEEVIELHCCGAGCTIKQWEYDSWNGRCAYEGMWD